MRSPAGESRPWRPTGLLRLSGGAVAPSVASQAHCGLRDAAVLPLDTCKDCLKVPLAMYSSTSPCLGEQSTICTRSGWGAVCQSSRLILLMSTTSSILRTPISIVPPIAPEQTLRNIVRRLLDGKFALQIGAEQQTVG